MFALVVFSGCKELAPVAASAAEAQQDSSGGMTEADYRAKIMRERIPWFAGAAVLVCVLVYLLVVSQRDRRMGIRLARLVGKRTNELTLQTATLAAAFDAIPDFIFCKDLNLRYTRCNKSFEKNLNLREEDIIGKTDMEGLGISAEQARQYNDCDRRVIGEGKMIVVEEYLPSPNGENQLFETVKVPLIQGGTITGLLGVSRNITQRKAMEEQALSASRAKSAFLANMSHEIRTPLNAIIGMTSIGKTANDIERKDYCFTKVQDASTHLLGVINDILDMSKIEAGKFELSPAEFNFEKALRKAVDVMSFRVDEKKQKFSLRIDENIPQTLIADDQRLVQVVTNLLGNAVKFTPEGGSLGLEARFLGEEDGLCTVQILINDTGIGISDEQQARLFTSFQQAESSTTRKFGGTGLGLAICKSIIEMMGGTIRIASMVGHGSTFAFSIRARRGEQAAQEEDSGLDEAAGEPGAGEPAVPLLFTGRCVLLAEDVEINREIVLALFEPTELKIDCVENGVEAVRAFSEAPEKYNMIFMDVQMPEMDGYEATQRIRAMNLPQAKTIPIVAMTANVFREDIEKCLEAGMNSHLGKPLDFDEVVTKLRTYL